MENLHLATFDIPERRYRGHVPILLDNGCHPAYVNSITVARDAAVYTSSRPSEEGKTDLIRFHPEELVR